MLLNQPTLAKIKEGTVTLAFRRWTRPTVKAGGTLLTAVGQLAIDSVEPIDESSLTKSDADAAGFESIAHLRSMLSKKTGQTYRVELRYAGPDPRIALREEIPDLVEMEKLLARLEKWDRSSPVGPWTRPALAVIRKRPATLAAELAAEVGMERDRFKVNVRKLKGLGLTESLERGYRLSPRGEAVADELEKSGA